MFRKIEKLEWYNRIYKENNEKMKELETENEELKKRVAELEETLRSIAEAIKCRFPDVD